MQSSRPGNRWINIALYIAAVATLFAAIVSPPTHRITGEQIAFMLPAAPTAFEPVRQMVGGEIKPAVLKRMAAFAAGHPEDDAMQTALATLGPRDEGDNPMRASVRNLAPLLDRYPRSVIIRSAVLRYTMGFAREFTGATAAEWAAFDRAASEGERLEPDNAFFPLMAAQGFDARGRKSETTQALLKAGRCTRWHEYIREELESMWRVNEVGDPWPDGLGRTASAGAMLYPQYSGLHDLATGQTEIALSLEAHGRTTDGLAIRHALMRVGALMRSQATVAIGNLVGVTMTNLASARTKAETVAFPTPLDRRQAYDRYLASIGRPDEAKFANAQIDAGIKVRAAFKSTGNWDGLEPLVAFIRAWVLAIVLLCGPALTLLSGGICAVLARMGWTDETRKIGNPERLGAWLASAVVVLVPAVWLAQRLTEPIRWTRGIFSDQVKTGLDPYTLPALLAVPIALKLVLIVSALTKRVSITITVVRGFQRFAALIAALMVLGYGAVLADLAQRDYAMAVTATERAQHEGRYIANRAGIAWPK